MWAKAKKDFEKAKKFLGENADIKMKLKETNKAYTEAKFAQAIAVEDEKPPSETIDINSFSIPSEGILLLYLIFYGLCASCCTNNQPTKQTNKQKCLERPQISVR